MNFLPFAPPQMELALEHHASPSTAAYRLPSHLSPVLAPCRGSPCLGRTELVEQSLLLAVATQPEPRVQAAVPSWWGQRS